MRYVKWLASAGLLTLTAACVEQSGYYPTTYGYSNGYYSQPTYYRSQPVYYSQPTYYRPAAYYAPAPAYHHHHHHHGGRDRNGDGIPDKYQWR